MRLLMHPRRRDLRIMLVVAVLLGLLSIIAALWFRFAASHGLSIDLGAYRSFKVPSRGMEPAILPGDYIFADMRWYQRNKPRRGDIVIFKKPPESAFLIKRIIALPGETVEVRRREVLINEKPLSEPYAQVGEGTITSGPVVVPEGGVFVLGDNRDWSRDSRLWEPPFVPIADIEGRTALVYWSTELKRIGRNF